MPDRSSAKLLVELRQRLEEHSHILQSAQSEMTEIRARSAQAVSQSRDLMAHADVLLTLPYVKQQV